MKLNRCGRAQNVLALLRDCIWIPLAIAVFVPSVTSAQITGTVIDSSNSTPVAGALVTRQGEGTQVTTAGDGSFVLNVSGPSMVIVAAKKGYFNSSVAVTPPATGLQIIIDPVPSWDDSGYSIAGPSNCGSCHSIRLDEWQDTPMALGGTNTWVYDIYSGNGTSGGLGGFVYTRDSVYADSNPNSECASCHQPQYWIENPYAALNPDIGSSDPGVMHGISCDICHKIEDVDTTKINYPGIYPGAVTFNRPEPGQQVLYGALADVSFEALPMMRASYQPQLAAEVCAVCHQDANDPEEDHSYSGVISEPTYLEWLASPYSNSGSPSFASCVDCHMPQALTNQVCTVIPPPDRDPARVRSHDIYGTTPEYLDNAVELEMTATQVGANLRVSVSINNSLTGHHVPTGVTVRNMILLVEAWEDGNDPLTDSLVHLGSQVVHDLGGIGDPAQGYFAGLPGKFFAKVNHDANGNGPTFFTDATGIQFDNRIPAMVTDSTVYDFRLPIEDATIHVRARLIYRRAFRFLVDAKGWTEDGHGNPLEDVMAPDFGHLMESSEEMLTTIGGLGAAIPVTSNLGRTAFIFLLAGAAWLAFRRRVG